MGARGAWGVWRPRGAGGSANPQRVVPVCVVTSVAKCVLSSTHCVSETPCVSVMACVSDSPCVSETPCMEEARCVSEKVFNGEAPRVSVPVCVSSIVCVKEMVRVNEARCVRETACVRSRYEREMAVGMREGTTACPSAMVECVSVRARENVRVRV